jgi:kumamolisin
MYELPGEGLTRAREGELKIPKKLHKFVTGVFGLDQRCVVKCHHRATARQNTPKPLTPAKLEKLYKFPAGYGAGETIAIAEFGKDPVDGLVRAAYITSDVAAFCEKHHRPVPKIRIESVGIPVLVCTREGYERYLEQVPKEVQDSLNRMIGETMMDAQIVAALCPKADIGIYFANSSEGGLINLLDAVTSGSGPVPVAVSISYGLAEQDPGWSCGAKKAINERLQIAALQGITVCASSGDDGSNCYQSDKRCHVEFPSSSPYVLSVGGTMLTQEGGQDVEEVWSAHPGTDGGDGDVGATGGGVSMHPRAPWQKVKIQSLNSGAIDGRVVPDVSALAGSPLYDLIKKPGGGTSAATPLWASLIARINSKLPKSKRQRFLPRLLYKLHKPGVGAVGFRDIELGDNISEPDPGIGYHAEKGFDAVSGLGVPKGRQLLRALRTV